MIFVILQYRISAGAPWRDLATELAAQMLAEEIGVDMPVVDVFRRLTDFRTELDFPEDDAPSDFRTRLRSGIRAAMDSEAVDGVLSEVAS